MKIIILQDDFPPESFGGAGIVSFRLAQGLKKFGNDIFVITRVKNKYQEGETIYEGVTIIKIYANFHERWRAYLSLYNPQTVYKIKLIIKKIKPDIVHAHNVHNYLSYHCLKIAKKNGARVFLTAHDTMLFHYGKLMEPFIPSNFEYSENLNYRITVWQKIKKAKKRYNPFRDIIIHYYLKYVDKIFAVSNALKEALEENGIRNTEVIYNGIDHDNWEIDERLIQKFKSDFNLINKKIILFGGRLSGAKGGEKIILAMNEVIKEVPETIMLVLGEKNEYAHNMLAMAKNSGMDKKVIFTGWLAGNELKSAYHTSDVIAVPSIYLDPFPTINLEAMACKKTIVGTCFGGTPEIIQDSVTGFIVNPFDVDKFSEKIIFLLKNPLLAKAMGETGYQVIKNKFSLDGQVKKLLEWYMQDNI